MWCLPLEPEQAEALARLLASLPGEPEVSEALARAIGRRRARRRADECLIDLARPDEDWWLSFATDTAPEAVAELLEHPEARCLPAIGRALVPIDDRSAQHGRRAARANHARAAQRCRRPRAPRAQRPRRAGRAAPRTASRPRSAIVMSATTSSFAATVAAGIGSSSRPSTRRLRACWPVRPACVRSRVLKARSGSRPTSATRSCCSSCCPQLEDASVDPRVTAWLEHASTWHGNIEVEGPSEEPVFLLLGDIARLPRVLREQARSAPGGATVPLTLDSWRLIEEQLDGWMSGAARRCIAALTDGRPAPPAVLELSTVHEDPTFVLAPGHDPSLLEAFAALQGALPRRPRRGQEGEHARLPAIRADPFCVPELDHFIASREVWVAPEALELLQEVREQHARAAGIVALSGATDAQLDVRGLGGELKPFQRAGVRYLLAQRRSAPGRRAGSRQDDRGPCRDRGRLCVSGSRRVSGQPQAQLVARARALATGSQRPDTRGYRPRPPERRPLLAWPRARRSPS